jgi:hypothetical protein
MASELRVFNQFREVILHIRLTSANVPELLTISATEDMRSAVSSLIGQDFDRTVGKGNELIRFTAKWGTPEYARVMADYFQNNFGWSTFLAETEQPSSAQVTDYEVRGNALAVGAGAGSLGFAVPSITTMGQLGNGHALIPMIAGIASQEFALGEL